MPVFDQKGRGGRAVFGVAMGRRAGQSMIESCFVIAIICLVLFGAFQISQLFASQEVLDYAAARGLRAKIVGFNQFMVFKTVRVGAIPNAGKLINPGHGGGPLGQYGVESARVPLYLGALDYTELAPILNYDTWGTASDVRQSPAVAMLDGTINMHVRQEVPLRYPFHRSFYAGDTVDMTGESTLDNHYTLYLNDQNW